MIGDADESMNLASILLVSALAPTPDGVAPAVSGDAQDPAAAPAETTIVMLAVDSPDAADLVVRVDLVAG